MNIVNDIHYEVLVSCMTYNQSAYIGDALKGFVMQQTDFPFVCLVMDDASTDGEPDVIKVFLEKTCDLDKSQQFDTEEAKIVIAKHRINDNCTFAVYFLKKNLFGSPKKIKLIDEWRKNCKYEALCEGDDYWTDPFKLQRQYSVMEIHPESTICFNRVQAIKADKTEHEFLIPRMECLFGEGKVTMKNLAGEEFKLGHWCFHTSSFFYKREIGLGYSSFRNTVLPSFPYGDMPLQMFALTEGSGYFIEDIMGCYRVLSGGWNSKMQANPELYKKMVLKIIAGLKEFDAYTNKKYHSAIIQQILRKEYYYLHDGKSRKLKYWKIKATLGYVKICASLKRRTPSFYKALKIIKDKAKRIV